MSETVLAVDPGRHKCGLAVGQRGAVLARAVVPRDQIAAAVAAWAQRYGVSRIVLGCGTGSDAIRIALASVRGLPPLETVQEAGTTLQARRRYFRDHPPRGWRRLIPLSLQFPPEAFDDYVAVLLLDRALGGGPDADP